MVLYRETPSTTCVCDDPLLAQSFSVSSIPSGLVKRTNGHLPTPTLVQSTLAESAPTYGISTLAETGCALSEPVFSPAFLSTKEWRAEKKAERSAFKYIPEVRMPWAPCELCGIYIGPGYIERSAYFLYVRNQTMTLSNELAYDIGTIGALLIVCSGCAKFHLVPESEKCIDEDDWFSMRYVPEKAHRGEPAMNAWERVESFIALEDWFFAYYYTILLRNTIESGINYRYYFMSRYESPAKKKRAAKHAKKQRANKPPQPAVMPEASPVYAGSSQPAPGMAVGRGMRSTVHEGTTTTIPPVVPAVRTFSFL